MNDRNVTLYSVSVAISASSCEECNTNIPVTEGTTNSFILNISAPLTAEELANENLVKIVKLETTDLLCNQLCWKCLGYKYR